MAQLEPFRRELTAYCYRMTGSPFEADDAAQEALTRAWKAFDRFEGRSSLRSWLYRIATNVCFDSLDKRRKRALPMDLGGASNWDGPMGAPLPESEWVLPTPDGRVLPTSEDPADAVVARDSIRLAFVAALQHLPPRQRAVLILCEVLRWQATEVADLLDTTVASVNSALQRARATLAEVDPERAGDVNRLDEAHRQLLDRYEARFLRYDVDALVALLHEDATLSMPPFPFWLQGAADAGRFWASPLPSACRNSRLVRVDVNGAPGFAQWKPTCRRLPPRGVGHPGPRRGRRAHQPDRLLPRHAHGLPAVRTCRSSGRATERVGYTAAPPGWWREFVGSVPARTAKLAVTRARRPAPRRAGLGRSRRRRDRVHDLGRHHQGQVDPPRRTGEPVLRRRAPALRLRHRVRRHHHLDRPRRAAPVGHPHRWALHGRRPGRGVRPPQRGAAGDAGRVRPTNVVAKVAVSD